MPSARTGRPVRCTVLRITAPLLCTRLFLSAKLHSVSESANLRERRRLDTARRITSSACRLAIENGYDGSTMNDLAEAAGVSRRTLFNYFPGKEDAVLGFDGGLLAELPEEVLQTFLDGGPTGHLLMDLGVLARELLGGEPRITRDELKVLHDVLERNPTLAMRAMERIDELIASITPYVGRRLGLAETDPRATVPIVVVASVTRCAVDAFVESDGVRQVGDLVAEYLEIAVDSLTGTH